MIFIVIRAKKSKNGLNCYARAAWRHRDGLHYLHKLKWI